VPGSAGKLHGPFSPESAERTSDMSDQQPSKLDDMQPPNVGVIGEFWYFLRTNKKWWLLPILLILLLFGVLMLLSGSAAAPFIYTLF
jgi:hypothetical protein